MADRAKDSDFPTNITRMNLVMGCLNAEAGV